ncbi:MAG: hypothetical protein U9Q30_10500 [Campylobacterota bacterium]|nr:hypothetical protein [Campylobacterota bacterium]
MVKNSKKIVLSLVASSLLTTASLADTQNVSVDAGWNLVGSSLDGVSTSNLDGVKTAWAFGSDDKKWKVYSPVETTASAIKSMVDDGSVNELSEINGGDGFWVNSDAITLNLEGTEASSVKALSSGWNLISFTGSQTKDIKDVFSNNNNIYTVWEYDSSTNLWKAWSPSNAIQTAIANTSSISALTEISSGKGYWINTQIATTLGIELSSSVTIENKIFVQNIGLDQTVIPVPSADLYVGGSLIGTTDVNGEFNFSNLIKTMPNGTAVTVMKDGYSTNIGIIDNGVLVLSIAPIDELSMPPIVPTLAKKLSKVTQDSQTLLAAAEGSQAPIANKVLRTPSGDMVILDTSSLTQSVTGVVTAYSYPEQIPMITNSISLPKDVNESMGFSNTMLPNQLSIIGGINISFTDANAKSILPENYNDLNLEYSVYLQNLIGDFNKIIMGITGATTDKKFVLNEETLNKFLEAKESGIVDFVGLLQNNDGSWDYLADAKFTITSKGTVVVSLDNDNVKLNDFGSGNIAFALRHKVVTGTTTICLDNGGDRMFDGSIINIPTSLESVEGAIIVGDEHITEQSALTDVNGCTDVNFKVPLLTPMYQFTAVKGGMYNKPVTVSIDFDNINAEQNATMLSKPDSVSILGYVKSIANSEVLAEDDAVVALRDPQILTAQKIMIDDSEDNRSITLEYAPNLTYSWTLRKDDSDASVVLSTTNLLTQKEVEDTIYDEQSPWFNTTNTITNPYGHYKIDVVVEHNYSNTDEKFTEAITIDFDAKIDEVALKDAFEFSVNGKASITAVDNSDGTTRDIDYSDNTDKALLSLNNIGIYSIYGGKEISQLKSLKEPADYTSSLLTIDPDEKTWLSDVIASGVNGESYCIDGNDSDYSTNQLFIDMSDMNELGASNECYRKVIDTTPFNNSILPFAQVYKMFYDNFDTMITTASGEDKPWYQSGFTVLNTYKAVNKTPETDFLHNVSSYTDLPSDKLNSVNDFSNILNFSVNPNEAIGFATMTDETDTDGSYRLDNIPPAIIPALELMARADGTHYDIANFRKADYPDSLFTGDLGEDEIPTVEETATAGDKVEASAGDVLVHNFMLNRIASTIEVPTTLGIDFENGLTDNTETNWSVETLEIDGSTFNASDAAVWQVVNNGNLPTIAGSYANDVYGDDISNAPSTILPTLYGENYAWMGNLATGTYDSDDSHVATALKSPVIDFANYSLATLSLKTWFEVSGIDSAWDTAFIGFEVVADENQTAGSEEILISWNGYSWPVTVGQTYIQRITPTNQVEWNIDENGLATTFSNNGINALPSWANYNLPLDFLAGKKAKIVFGFFTGDSAFNNMMGWGIDNIEITDNKDFVITMPPSVPSFNTDMTTEIIDGNSTTLDVNLTVID